MCMAFGLVCKILFLVFLHETLASLLLLSFLTLLHQMPLWVDTILLEFLPFHLAQNNLQMENLHDRRSCANPVSINSTT